ncbi:hypothetical protein DPMN_153266 [Dreissena polymorpha]|uniref:Uncharacterized protein n=1 Tax=Dreissena polymorpha TaxID=45954 RepID=A0A9D4J5X6_DREPO|nr:hypothetical protein DPMN_153266 [Dreissena polymorpha]
MLSYRICENVVRIGEEAEEFDVEEDFENLPQNILARCETINSEHIEMEKQLETLQSSFDETLLEVASFQKKMTDAIEKLGQLSTSELKTMFTSIHETCINEIQRHSEINQRYKHLQKGHESIKQDNKQLAFILCKKYDELYEETDSLYKRKDNREISFRFHAEASMLQLLSKLASLEKVQTYKNESSKVIKVSEKTEFTISEVSETGMIIGICELANRKFIIAERSNAKTYLLDDSLKVVSHLYLKSHPQESVTLVYIVLPFYLMMVISSLFVLIITK